METEENRNSLKENATKSGFIKKSVVTSTKEQNRSTEISCQQSHLAVLQSNGSASTARLTLTLTLNFFTGTMSSQCNFVHEQVGLWRLREFVIWSHNG